MNIKKVVVGMLNTNCYILENDDECLIIDPGDDFLKIRDNVDKRVVGVLLTHRHFDHIGALNEVLDYYGVGVNDAHNLKEGKNKLGSFNFKVVYNYGHTLDSISFIFDDIMFSGDFIFENAIGRTDLGGNDLMMLESIRKILSSKYNYRICPGHGRETTLDKEREMLEGYLK